MRFGGTIGSVAPSTAHQVTLDLVADNSPATFVMEPPAFHLHVWSKDAGASWSRSQLLNSRRVPVSGIARTSLGSMVGDYISTSFAGGRAVPVFVLASAPRKGLREAESRAGALMEALEFAAADPRRNPAGRPMSVAALQASWAGAFRFIDLAPRRDVPVDGARPDPSFTNVVDVIGDAAQRGSTVTFTGTYINLNWHQTFLAGTYTLSTSETNTTGAFGVPSRGDDLAAEWGPSDYDVRQRLVLTARWEGPRDSGWRVARNWQASGVFSAGFTTMRLLVATAGATLWITWLSGWLNGVMAEMAPSSGSRSV